MANRRMFSKTITNSSNFLMMPQSSQNLYFHLGMNADDDGFCEHFSIMRMTDSKPDDLRILQSKKFISIFDDKVLIILDWKENNYLRPDRYTKSKYIELYKKELNLIGMSSGIPQVDTGKVRIGKVRIDKNRVEEENQLDTSYKAFEERLVSNWGKLSGLNNAIKDIRRIGVRADKIKARFKEPDFRDNLPELFEKINKSDWLTGKVKNWAITFDWLIANNKNYIKILEGQYDNK